MRLDEIFPVVFLADLLDGTIARKICDVEQELIEHDGEGIMRRLRHSLMKTEVGVKYSLNIVRLRLKAFKKDVIRPLQLFRIFLIESVVDNKL